MTPLKAIRARCVDCCAGELVTVRRCDFKEECPLWPFRMGKGVRGQGGLMRPIRQYCLWCVRDQPNEARLCPSVKCALHPYRLGRRPTTRPLLSEKPHSTSHFRHGTPIEAPDGQGRQLGLFQTLQTGGVS